MKIAIIDDDSVDRRMLRQVVARIHPAAEIDEFDGLATYDATAAAVILDLHLPPYTGAETIRRLRSLDPSCFLICVSGKTHRKVLNVIDKSDRIQLAAAVARLAAATGKQ